MKQKKTMKLWQFIVTECLLLIMFITMFIPMFSFSGSSMIKGTKKVFKNMELDIDEEEIDEYLQQVADELDAEIEKYEEENNVQISSISPCNIMINSFVDFLYGDSLEADEVDEFLKSIKEDETGSTLQEAYNTLRILFWIVYVVILFVMILGIIGFCAKFVKYITLSINIFCGLYTVSFFAYLRFAVAGVAAEKAGETVNNMLGVMASYLDMEALINAILNGIYVLPFTIIILGVSAIFMFCSILFMFIGKPTVSIQNELQSPFGADYQEISFGTMQNDYQDQVTVPMTDNLEESSFASVSGGYQDQVTVPMTDNLEESPFASVSSGYQDQVTVPMTDNLEESPFEPTADDYTEKTEALSMGRVWVKKGIAKGQGFMLPQNRKVVVGKNPQNANLVINNPHISNIHCSIRYNAESNTYIVKDHSSNGTFVDGIQLQKNTAMEYPAGTVLSLADGSEEIQLG